MKEAAAQKLHDLMEDIYKRSLLAKNPKDYFPIAIGEFAKELYYNPLLNDLRDRFAKEAQEETKDLLQEKTIVLTEFADIITLLEKYDSKQTDISDFLNEIHIAQKTYTPHSHDLLYALLRSLVKIIKRLFSDYELKKIDHSEILTKLIYPNAKDNIFEYKFLPSLNRYLQESKIIERKHKTSAYMSFHYLTYIFALFYDLKNRGNRINHFAEATVTYFNTQAINFDQALETRTEDEALSYDFDLEECKTHVNRMWSCIKKYLEPTINNLSEQRFTVKEVKYKYIYSDKKDCKQGFLLKGKEQKEHFTGISAALLNFMIQQKRPISPNELVESKVGKTIIDARGTATPIDQLRNAREVLIDKLQKYFGENVIIAKNGLWEFNPLYRHRIYLSKKTI